MSPVIEESGSTVFGRILTQQRDLPCSPFKTMIGHQRTYDVAKQMKRGEALSTHSESPRRPLLEEALESNEFFLRIKRRVRSVKRMNKPPQTTKYRVLDIQNFPSAELQECLGLMKEENFSPQKESSSFKDNQEDKYDPPLKGNLVPVRTAISDLDAHFKPEHCSSDAEDQSGVHILKINHKKTKKLGIPLKRKRKYDDFYEIFYKA